MSFSAINHYWTELNWIEGENLEFNKFGKTGHKTIILDLHVHVSKIRAYPTLGDKFKAIEFNGMVGK